jgi:hypothetical protein
MLRIPLEKQIESALEASASPLQAPFRASFPLFQNRHRHRFVRRSPPLDLVDNGIFAEDGGATLPSSVSIGKDGFNV